MLPDTPPIEPLTCTVKTASQILGISEFSVTSILDAGGIQSGYTETGRRLVNLDSLRTYVATLPAKRKGADEGDAA
jgi:hypothetical protein